MKLLILFLLILIPFNTFSQTPEITILEEKKSEIQNQITTLQKEINVFNKEIVDIDSEIETLTNEYIIQEAEGKSINAITKKRARLKREPLFNLDGFHVFEEETTIQIVGYKDEYYEVCYEDKCGFMSELWIQMNPALKAFTAAIKDKALQEKITEVRAKKEDKKEYYIKKYGQSGYNKMQRGGYWRGMTTEQARYTLGSPQKVNSTVGSWGRHEQWVYSNGRYLYFENGVLTSYQN